MRPEHDHLGSDGDDLGRVVDVLLSMDEPRTELFDPPAGLWDDIAARLTEDVLGSITVLRTPSDDPVDTSSDNVTHLEDRRRQRWTRIAAAAAVVVIAAGTFGVITANDSSQTQEIVASVDLEVLSGPSSAQAELVRVDGQERLVIDARDLPAPPDGTHYELWMIDSEVTDPQSMGSIPPGDQLVEVPVPDDLDPADYPIVDINVQQDGMEQHSGLDTSVLRGVLA